MSNKTHGYHIIDPSPWPILASLSLLMVTGGGVMWMHKLMMGHIIFPLGVFSILYCAYKWWHDVVKEGMLDKAHTAVVQKGLRLGMALFIVSEIMFFAAFFWSYFKAALDPVAILDGVWAIKEGMFPPAGVEKLDAWDIPFINTLILLLSGTTVTWAHYEMEANNKKEMVKALGITILLGISFSLFQLYEYIHATFKFRDGIFSSNFYMATGFHGFHVMIGTMFLAVCYFRAKKGHFGEGQGNLGMEFAAWYWHFVDVVWLFLFAFVYVA